MTSTGRSVGLRTIFSFFLGVMLTAFFGVGVNTFHPAPSQFEGPLKELSHREQEVRGTRPSGELTPAEREQLQEIARQRTELNEKDAEAKKPWGRSTSILLMALATLTMAVSLVRADQLPVISNGLLLGGVFTMLYGVGWIIATDTSVTKFFVMTAALAITLGMGYVRFVSQAAAAPANSAGMGTEALSELERRVADLEERVNGAAQMLARRGDGA